eukprot:940400_1
MDEIIGIYYESFGVHDYYVCNEGKFQFLEGYEDEDLYDEIMVDDPYACYLVEFDDNFPLTRHGSSHSSASADEIRIKEIHRLLKQFFIHGHASKALPKIRTIRDLNLRTPS